MTTQNGLPIAPIAKRQPTEVSIHGDFRIDEYAWLRAQNWQQALEDPFLLEPEIREYLENENRYAETTMADTKDLQKILFEELKGRIEEEDSSVPDRDGDYAYYVRHRKGGQHPIYCRRHIQQDQEEILLDGDSEAQGEQYFHIDSFEHSPDHRYIAYCIDTNGSEYYTLHLKDTQNAGPPLVLMGHLQGDLTWAADSRHLFYTRLNEAHRPDSVFCYCVGDDAEQATLVYQEQDPGFFVNLNQTRSRRFIVIHVHNHDSSENWLIPTAAPNQAPQLIRQRTPEIEYQVEECRGRLIIHTNIGDAEDYKLMTANPAKPAQWSDFYLPKTGVLLEDILVFENYLVCLEREAGLPRIIFVRAFSDDVAGEAHRICFDEPCYELDLIDTFDYRGEWLRFNYTSMKTPNSVYDYNMQNHEKVLRKKQKIPSGYHPERYQIHRFLAHASDGETIPLSVLHAHDTPLDGSAPLLLYAYGAYGHSMPAAFSSHRLSLVNRGFVYAIAHVRGGMEKGYAWYKAGKLNQKKNTFGDFIACAEHLIKQKFTKRQRIAIQGGSAGGLTIGAVLNMRPELFQAALAEVPFMDVLNTICDDTLPLTPPEWQEWGDPIVNSEVYQYIKSYSPYDQIRQCDYPHVLVTTGLSDPRVTYWEPAKWVARLRAHKTDSRLLLLKVNMMAGHSGVTGRFDYLKEIAFKYAFLLKVFNKQLK